MPEGYTSISGTNSGSESRQRAQSITVRVTATEKQRIAVAADQRRLSIGAYMRQAALVIEPRLRRRTSLSLSEGRQIAFVLACLGQLNDHIKAIERHGGVSVHRQLVLAMMRRDLISLRDRCFEALGRAP